MGQVSEQYNEQRVANLATKVAKLYLHYADLAAYATMRVNGKVHLPIGRKDRSWWTSLMDECVAKRDTLHQVLEWLHTDLGFRVSPRSANWTVGMEIYLRDFCLEGTEQTFDEYIQSSGLDWTRDLGDFVERDPPPDQYYGGREFEAPGSAGAPDIPPPERCFPDFPFDSLCKLYILKTYGEVLPNLKEDYIGEAEHQDGPGYWAAYFQKDDGSLDKEAIAKEMVLYALNASPTDGDQISPATDMSP